MEAAGAVFLPASGRRNGSRFDFVQSYGRCWSATPNDSSSAGYLDFDSKGAAWYNYIRYYGLAVRLVQDL